MQLGMMGRWCGKPKPGKWKVWEGKKVSDLSKKKDMMILGTQKKQDVLNLGRICFCNTIVAFEKQRNV